MTQALGTRGEEVAVRHLETMGCRVVERDCRCRTGEIDCEAADRGTLVFVEGKARWTARCGGSLEAVDERKRRRMTGAAREFDYAHRLGDVPQRFDVVAVWMGGPEPTVEVFPNAFEVEP